MNIKAEALKTRFFVESREYLSRGSSLLAGLISGTAAEDDVHELFRCVHSIKSEAAFLKMEEITAAADLLEERLEALRTGQGSAEDLDTARALLTELEKKIRASEKESAAPPKGPVFNQFEQRLIAEARRHGEILYRVHCDLDPEAPMKQARAYLLLSNLEQLSSVIRTEPSVHTRDDDAFASISFYLTAGADETEIYRAIDIDQVVRSTVEVLEYSQLDSRGQATLRETSPLDLPSLYRVGSRKLNQMTAYADELKITLRELDLDLSRDQDVDPQIRGRVTRLSHLANGLFEELKQTRTARLHEEFLRLENLVQDLAAGLGKDIRCVTEGSEIEIDRRSLSALSEPLMHLVRNAVDHGIETPEERTERGKSAAGRIVIKAFEEDNSLAFSVSDDGRGIDEQQIRSNLDAEADGEPVPLMELLSRPGFTTLESATNLSGRGVGLDLVVQRVEAVGGTISLDTQPGSGATFTISLPKGPAFSQLLFFRYGNELYAVHNGTVTGVERMQKSGLKRSAGGRIFYKGQPAYSGPKPAEVGSVVSYGSFVILVTSFEANACLLADDVLFEHDVQEDLLKNAASRGQQRLAVRFGSGKREFYYLPSAIFS